jgi:hypothetical protein
MLLLTGPEKFFELNVALISELLPAATVREETSATVHPQDVVTCPIVRGESPLFFRTKTCSTFLPWVTDPKSNIALSTEAWGAAKARATDKRIRHGTENKANTVFMACTSVMGFANITGQI